jgi:hypothetical protein
MKKSFLLLGAVLLLFVLAGCSRECKVDSDCVKPHFAGRCDVRVCEYTPIPNECGNSVCDSNENKCTCAFDCGICQGTNGPYLKYSCVDNACLDAVPLDQVKPVYLSSEAKTSGITFKATSDFNQPFNLKKDLFRIDFSAMAVGTASDITLRRLEVSGTTKDQRVITLYDKPIDRPIALSQDVSEQFVLSFPSSESYGELSNLVLEVFYDYSVVASGKTSQRSASFQIRYPSIKSFVWVMPKEKYLCPASCDDQNPATEDACGADTNFFCMHRPIVGQCGNGLCEPAENKCTCASDCGPCSGASGNYMSLACIANRCVSQLRPSFSPEAKKIFDDRDLSYFHLQNNYDFNDPFNIRTDAVSLSFSLYDKKEEVSQIRITDIRLFEGVAEIAYIKPGIALSSVGESSSASLSVSDISGVEDAKALTLAVWYEYDRGGQVAKSDFRKSLGSITLVKPGV